jgi:hypothetical protein
VEPPIDSPSSSLSSAEKDALIASLLAHAEESRAQIEELRNQLVEQQRLVAALRDEIARLKGGPGRPNIKPNVKPSGMERGTEPRSPKGKKPPRGSTRSKLTINEERIVKAAVPPGSRFKGYTSYVVQDLVIRTQVVNFRCERWETPDGEVITAPLPAGIDGHFGAELRRFVLAQYHEAQTTVPRLLKLLHSLGIVISKRQLVRLLTVGQDGFVNEARDVLRAGLSTASWITVDDTGARHKGTNGFCTQIGNDDFTWFGTTSSKSRLNFLELLRAGHSDYVINDEALAYMRERALARHVIDRLAQHPDKQFSDQKTWNAHLDALGITALKVTPNPVLIATEGALWGSVKAHGLLPNTVIVSDDAGQFDVGAHGLCWVHAERLVHKLDTFTDEHRIAQAAVRSQIWDFYADLKAYRRAPTPASKDALQVRFDSIFTLKTCFVTLDRLMGRLHANKSELLMVLERPEIPLHTNTSENDVRCHVTRRKVSGGTRSDSGRDCRDAFLGLVKTCAKHAISFWDFLGDRLAVPGANVVPRLAELVYARAIPP